MTKTQRAKLAEGDFASRSIYTQPARTRPATVVAQENCLTLPLLQTSLYRRFSRQACWRWALPLALAGTFLSGCTTIETTQPGSSKPARQANAETGVATSLPRISVVPTDTNPLEKLFLDRANQPDIWGRLRVGFAMPELDTPDVDRFARSFAEKHWLEKLAPRARRYLYLLVVEAEKRHIPTELALLPIIESGLNPGAVSPASAAGLCQFIPATGRRFGLHQSTLVDRRKDLACVGAMYSYLQDNAALFKGDWLLALAAYNWGEGAVARTIERNARAGLPTDYLSLRMPNETRAYVPQLLALKQLILNPARYGIELPSLGNHPSIDCEVAIPGDLDVSTASRLAGISLTEFRQLNSGVKTGIIPRATHPTICLPFAAAVHFIVNIGQHRGPLASMTTYTVPNRTTLLTLAKRYRTTPEVIRQANDIPAGMRLRAGATILVPKARGDHDIPSSVASTAQLLIEPDVPDTRKVVVTSKRRDTLGKLAKRHAISVLAIQKWNPGIKDPLKAGQKLVLHLPVKKSLKPTTTRRANLTITRSST